MLKKVEINFFFISFIVLALTGLLYIYFRDFSPKSEDVFSVVSSPWQSWMIKAHVLFSPVFVAAVGWVFAKHAWPRYSQRGTRGKKSGISNMILLIVAILTGYLLQVLTDDAVMQWTSWVHIIIGLFCLMMIAIHQKITKR